MKLHWYENLSGFWQDVIDQTLHFAAGFFLSAALTLPFSIGFAVGREVGQNWGDEDNDYVDMAIDVAAWVLGAIFASVVF